MALGFILLKQINVLKYNKFIQLAYSKAYFKVKFKETSYFTSFEIVVALISNLIIAQVLFLFLLKSSSKYMPDLPPIVNVLIIFTVLFILFFIKYYIENLINFCFANDRLLKSYVFYKQMLWSYAVYLGLPFLIFYVYNSTDEIYVLFASLGVMGVFYILNIIYFIYRNRKHVLGNWYYFILYICALEIAPYYFLFKVFAIE